MIVDSTYFYQLKEYLMSFVNILTFSIFVHYVLLFFIFFHNQHLNAPRVRNTSPVAQPASLAVLIPMLTSPATSPATRPAAALRDNWTTMDSAWTQQTVDVLLVMVFTSQ